MYLGDENIIKYMIEDFCDLKKIAINAQVGGSGDKTHTQQSFGVRGYIILRPII